MRVGNREMVVQSLFPEPVGFFNINRALTDEEKFFLNNQETMLNAGNTTSINNYVLDTPVMSSLRSSIQESVNAYFKFVYAHKDEVSLRITQSWVNYTKPNQHHHKHAHANSIVSGVFYVNANKNTDKIIFFSSKMERFAITSTEHNIFSSRSWYYEVGTGDIILFSSTLPHSVDPVEGEETRVSLAFNTFPVGVLGDNRALTELKL